MEWFVIYLFVMIEKISKLFDKGYTLAICSLLVIIVIVILGLLFTNDKNDEKLIDTLSQKPFKGAMRLAKIGTFVGILLGVSGDLLPDQKQLAIIVGSGVTYNVLTSEPAKRIGGKALQLIEQKVDDALKDEPIRENIEKKAKAAVIEKVEGASL